MNVLEGAGAVGALFRGAAGLVREIKRPKLDDQQFATLLQAQLKNQESAPQGDSAGEILAVSNRFVTQRDANGDGLLSLEESGLDKETFARLDADNDGRLTPEEVAQPRLDALRRFQKLSEPNGND
ncbi:MAG: hypothetical protein ACLFTT_13710 [Candidatus Hydrogenedentota bacterium]